MKRINIQFVMACLIISTMSFSCPALFAGSHAPAPKVQMAEETPDYLNQKLEANRTDLSTPTSSPSPKMTTHNQETKAPYEEMPFPSQDQLEQLPDFPPLSEEEEQLMNAFFDELMGALNASFENSKPEDRKNTPFPFMLPPEALGEGNDMFFEPTTGK